jgi:hypothetical protein
MKNRLNPGRIQAMAVRGPCGWNQRPAASKAFIAE